MCVCVYVYRPPKEPKNSSMGFSGNTEVVERARHPNLVAAGPLTCVWINFARRRRRLWCTRAANAALAGTHSCHDEQQTQCTHTHVYWGPL